MVQAVSSAETTNKKHLSTVKKGAVIGAIAGGITQTAGNIRVDKYVPEIIETAKEMLESYGLI